MFNSYEDLMKAVEDRRNEELTLEVDLGNGFSQDHEDAKRNLKVAESLGTLAGNQPFLNDNLDSLKAKVEETRPPSQPVWIKFKRLSLMEWAVLIKTQGITPVDQYEKVLNKTFVGVFNSPDSETPLSDDPRLLSTKGDLGILPGGAMHSVVQAFMSWQNSGGDVSIHPTKSGRD
jgi:hypothetical protein